VHGGERLEAAMQCDAHCAFTHSQILRDIADRLPFDADRADDRLLAPIEFADKPLGILQVEVAARLLGGKKIDDRLDGYLYVAAAAAQRVDELVARDRPHPRAERLARVPRMALQVNCKQSLLHHVLDIVHRGAELRKPTTGGSTKAA
jgi:hypothetical protein